MEVIFERLRTEHLDEILKIEQESFLSPWTRGMFEREMNMPVSRFFSAVHDGRVIGYGGYWLIHNEAHILNIAVTARERRKGVGRLVLTKLLNDMKERKVIKSFLEVRKRNIAARNMYVSLGFVENGIREQYYTDDDAILMEKEIE